MSNHLNSHREWPEIDDHLSTCTGRPSTDLCPDDVSTTPPVFSASKLKLETQQGKKGNRLKRCRTNSFINEEEFGQCGQHFPRQSIKMDWDMRNILHPRCPLNSANHSHNQFGSLSAAGSQISPARKLCGTIVILCH